MTCNNLNKYNNLIDNLWKIHKYINQINIMLWETFGDEFMKIDDYENKKKEILFFEEQDDIPF